MARGNNIHAGRSRLPADEIPGPRTVRVANAVKVNGGSLTANPAAHRQDAFGNAIFVEPLPLFNASQQVDDSSELFYTTQSAGGTFATSAYATNQSSSLLNLSDGGVSPNGAYAMRCSRYVPYIPACGHRAEMTFTMTSPLANLVQEVGYFEAPVGVPTNGCFLRYTTAGIYLVLVSDIGGAVAETAVIQTSWNGDSMAGFDPTKRTIMAVDLQWLSYGAVRVLFDMGSGDVRVAHTFENVQTGDTPYMRSATLPVTWLIRATGNVAAKRSLRQTCCSVKSYGVVELPGRNRVVGRGSTLLAVNARVPFVSFRCQSRYIPAIVQAVNLATIGLPVYWELVLNGTLGAGTAWGALAGTRLDIDVGSTTLAGGAILASGYVAAASVGVNRTPGAFSAAIHEKFWASMSPGGVFDIMTLATTGLGGATNTYADLHVQEVF